MPLKAALVITVSVTATTSGLGNTSIDDGDS